jgi:hypothetical protein
LTSCSIVASSVSAHRNAEALRQSVTAGQALSVFVDNLDRTRSQAYTITVAGTP